MSANNHDTSTELHVSRFRNGIKVQRPSTILNHSQSIGDLVKNNFTVIF